MFKLEIKNEEDVKDIINTSSLIEDTINEAIKKSQNNPFNDYSYQYSSMRCSYIEFYIDKYLDTGTRAYISKVSPDDYEFQKYISDYVFDKLKLRVEVVTEW